MKPRSRTRNREQKYKYILAGKRWARGWNVYEAVTMRWLMAIFFFAGFFGIVTGIAAAVWLELETFWIVVITVLVDLVVLWIGLAVARLIIPFIWDLLLSRDLET